MGSVLRTPLLGPSPLPARARPGPHFWTHLRDPKRDVFHGFETSGPQQNFFVKLRRLELSRDSVNLPCKTGPGWKNARTHHARARLQLAPHPPPQPLLRTAAACNLPGWSPVATHPDSGAQSCWGSRHFCSVIKTRGREERPCAPQLLAASPGRSGEFAPSWGAEGTLPPPACCASFPRPRPNVGSPHPCHAQSPMLPGELGKHSWMELLTTAHWSPGPHPWPRPCVRQL